MSDIRSEQFNINPFQRVEIDIGITPLFVNGIDRSNGEYFPQLEGQGLVVERSEFPVLISLVTNNNQIQTAIPLKDGLRIDANFKGFYLSHPPMNKPLKLSIIIKKGCASIENPTANPLSRMGLLTRQITAGPNNQKNGIYIPPGARALRNLQCVVSINTTITAVYCSQEDDVGSSIIMPTNLTTTRQTTGVILAYANTVPLRFWGVPSGLIGTAIVYTFPPVIPVMASATEFAVFIGGTGLANALEIQGYWE